jgi:hypothetical protein
LIAEQDPARYGRAAARWDGRFVVECGVGLEDATLALVALASIPWSNAAIAVLVELGTRYRVPNIESALRRFRTASSSRIPRVVPVLATMCLLTGLVSRTGRCGACNTRHTEPWDSGAPTPAKRRMVRAHLREPSADYVGRTDDRHERPRSHVAETV